MKKLFAILFLPLLAVTLSTDKFQLSVNDNQNDFETEKVKLIVKFKEGVFQAENYRHTTEDISSNSIQKAFKDFGITATEAVFKNRYNEDGKRKSEILQLSNHYFLEGWQFIILRKDLADKFISQLKLHCEVEEAFIEEPFKIKPAIVPNDPSYTGGGQWHLNDPIFPNADIRAEQAWDINRGRNDVVIGILDGGVDYNHLDLDPGNRIRVIAGTDTGDGDNDPLDNLPDNDPESFAGHGTSIAGVVGAITNNSSQVAGVMWNCQIMPVKMVRSGGIRIPHIVDWDWSTSAFPSDVADAIDYAVNNGANVINLSYSFPDMGWPVNEVILRVPHIFQAIDNAYKNNVVITASMGNEFETDNRTRYPAGFREQVMAVGATTRSRTKASFSNTGSHISVSAPGVGIVTTERGGGIRSVSGTSFSAPLTAGVAGLVISQGKDRNFNLTNDDVRHIIELTAQDIGAVGYDNETGNGIVNARNALQLIAEPNILYHYNSVGGTSTKTQTFSQWIILSNRWGIAAGTYLNVDQYKVTKHINFTVPFCSTPTVWMRERESKSLNYGNPNSGRPDAFITNVTNTGFDLEYVTYYVRYNVSGQTINKWVPAAPASINVAYTAVGPPNLVATAGPIIGSSIICTSQTYQVSNLPPGSTVTWSSTWNSAPYPTLVQNSPAANQCTINNSYQYPSTTTLTATINGPCGTRVLTKQVTSDYSNPVQYGTYYQEACYFYNTYNPSSSGSLPTTVNTPLYLRQGCLATITLNSIIGKTVTYTGAVQPLYWYYNSTEGKLYLQLPYMSGGIPFTFKITGEGACQEKSLLLFSYSQPYYPSYSFSISPNPVGSEYLTISATPSDEFLAEKGVETASTDLEYAVGVIDLVTGETVTKGINFKGKLEERLDISKLRKGLYSLQIFWKGETQSIRFLKE